MFVSGNHDSDTLSRSLARRGAIVLTERGPLLPDGGHGDTIVRVGGLRVAGYSDPFERRRANGYRAGREPEVTASQQRGFLGLAASARGPDRRGDGAFARARRAGAGGAACRPARRPLVFLTGHTHEQELKESDGIVSLNGGTVGGGGAGNFDENQPYGLAMLTYEAEPSFDPLAADLVRIDAPDGSANAERRLLD